MSVVQKYTLPETTSVDDFVFKKRIGQGGYGSVFLAKNINNDQEYAVKVMDRVQMQRKKISQYIDVEKEALSILSECTNYFVKMYGVTQDYNFVYFILGFEKNGELFDLCQNDYFNLAGAKYYAAEVLLALEVLHSKGIIHKDLKPENILLDENWHIRIADFGLSKILYKEKSETKESTNSMMGTIQFISPEVISHHEAVFATDLWSYGCVVYQMVCGQRVFDGSSETTTSQLILELEYDFPWNFDISAKDLVQKLLVLQPELRLGASDSQPYQSIRDHKFFCDIDWNNMGEPPKILPSDNDCSNSEVVYSNTTPGFNNQILQKLYD